MGGAWREEEEEYSSPWDDKGLVERLKTPRKKKLGEVYKGEKWQSGSRCEMKIMEKEGKAKEKEAKEKAERIKQNYL